ncbi:MAG: polysaccharide deacetylase family protein, partial [Thermoleophilia bacterium]|nr:polysaccharide deacetylase family protein [Gaiellaceae bacterium]MDW8339480.1 polysaccharide deacetylase family protein [Thermoleophilia bacterium]
PGLFRAHLEWLREFCDVIPFRDVLREAQVERQRPAVALTFDDGYRDNHAYALPVLEETGLSATFFVTVGLVERDPAVVARFARMRGVPAAYVEGLSWTEVAELASAGHEIGSHTWSHPVLARVSEEAVRRELIRSRETLEDRLQRAVTSLAYPFGKLGAHVTATTAAVARETGHTIAAAVLFRSVRSSDSPLLVPRFFATRDDLGTLWAKVHGRWDWLGAWQERAPRWLSRIVSPADYRDLGEAHG